MLSAPALARRSHDRWLSGGRGLWGEGGRVGSPLVTPPVSLTHKKEVQSTKGAFWKIWCSFFSCREEEDVAGKRTGRSYDLHHSSPRKAAFVIESLRFLNPNDDFKLSFKFVFHIFSFSSQSEICSQACQFDLQSLFSRRRLQVEEEANVLKSAQEAIDTVRNEKRLPAFLLLPSCQ